MENELKRLDRADPNSTPATTVLAVNSEQSSGRRAKKKTRPSKKARKHRSGRSPVLQLLGALVIVLGMLCYAWHAGVPPLNLHEISAWTAATASLVFIFIFLVHGSIFLRGFAILVERSAAGLKALAGASDGAADWLDARLDRFR
ncbi:MAG TPA: hypothetical protein VGO01_13035 [Bradyrhizobium sp.]|jgi:cation transport ATPase|nr:hypothetical protein [Bradyrhizobium sp.]